MEQLNKTLIPTPKQLCPLPLACFILFFFISRPACTEPGTPALPLANVYKEGIDLDKYLVSEKLDGARAYWDGRQLLSRQGNTYHAPAWFTAGFPEQPLDGELWIAHNSFEQLMSIIRDTEPTNSWRKVRYMVFDIPLQDKTFTERMEKLKTLFADISSPYIHLITQSPIANHDALMEQLAETVNTGGEGLMLRKMDSFYSAGRSNDLLKVKSWQDAEAVIIAHIPGKGKYTGMLGALLVETADNIRFRLGTGFTNLQRKNPPPVGSLVTYKYQGKTINGVPRFASFLRIRNLPQRTK